MTDRTLCGHRSRIAAIVASQHILAFVVNEAHITVDALGHMMTFVAFQTQREGPPVLEQDDLVVLAEGFQHGID